ncbi:cysteine hydrolase [Aureimonas flava]|uniref:Cysteine hydrolase n=1 Tax=Aureimonas flava TaxID=2320271 RepID=A0A3A1WPA7_9HYPH|nr:isochorismatase family cysteine hydrolase [Aureimonas flava]RIY02573.1 cysteine hydrolase [Aureimonas flava]
MTIALDRAALVAIDLQNEYRAEATYPVEGFAQVLERNAALMREARARAIPVWHVQAATQDAETDAYPLLHGTVDASLRSGVAGSALAEICAEVAPEPGDVVFRKIWPSAFRGSDFDRRLRAAGIDTLLVTGVWTDSCVQGTVFDAVYAGFHVWLVKDACGSGTQAMHRTAVLGMANRLYGGGVTASDRLLAAMRGEAARHWRCTRPVEFLYRTDTVDALYESL